VIEGLPPVPSTVPPADREAYRAALGFEQVLLGELTKAMVPEGTLTDGPYATTVQESLASGLAAAGGIGLAAQLYPLVRKETA
jgi:hypothetical protein